jgi:aminoglycoside phosphotransferase (APT) family kinase protein
MPEISVMVMGHASIPSLAERVAERGATNLLPAFRNCGAWLRAFHDMPLPEHAIDHALDANAVVEAVERSADFLASQIGDADFFRSLCTRFRALTTQALRDPPERKIAHADYWLGNMLVDENARVTVIDTTGAWYGPIYNDLSYFLYTLDAPLLPFSRKRVFSVSDTAKYRDTFLAGYFGEAAVPYAAITLFELQLQLHLWARSAATADYPGVGRIRYRAKLFVRNPVFRRAAQRRLEYAERMIDRP